MIRVNLIRDEPSTPARPYFSSYPESDEATLLLTNHARPLVLRVFGRKGHAYGRGVGRYRPVMRWRLM
jgi:hypothetical protein